ncbi:BRE1 E3 ubiquitin ligase-domain-containing protein [Podospora fimiseda]|uniref:E3 ubiquitin protein ligase n=1 Tax=Podospora fimiseda TaxID=252190 RepID=A0AAN7BZK0_9PEZI|nr:BRE1 E3 ubiquitin ligase-domain-containing protein [Podospora fimiseda]
MEDRKRPASSNIDDGAPPNKRQAVNGSSKSKDDSGEQKGEEAWIEEFTKGAIYRQMQEYKRERNALEIRVQDLVKNTADHDDHVRIIDAFVLQLLQEIELLVDGTISSRDNPDLTVSSLSLKDLKSFQKHLGDKAKIIKFKADEILKRLSLARGEVKPEVAQLEEHVKDLLANEKELNARIGRLESEKTSISAQFDVANLRAFKAERKLDRLKSTQVQKLEQQALASSTSRASGNDSHDDKSELTNGNSSSIKAQYKEAMAVVAKQKQQLEEILAENKSLVEENSTFKVKKESVSDEDYIKTDVFRHFKAQSEDLIKRINHLEATNKQLREEAEKLRVERTEWKINLEAEAQELTSELEKELHSKESDLTRIRSARDELAAELAMRKASQDQEKTAISHMKEMVDAKLERINQLESELDRLRPSEDVTMSDPRPDLESLSPEELRQKCAKLEKDFEAINKELPLLEKSYIKERQLAHSRVMDFHALEERVAVLIAEKAKADQKYFAARKDMDIRSNEIRALRNQNGKSSDIIAQLKDVELQNRNLISNLEKQVASLKSEAASVVAEKKRLEQMTAEATRRADSVKAQILSLTELVKTKDGVLANLREQTLHREQELEKIKVRLEEANKDSEKWRRKCQSNSTEEEEVLRNMVICTVCRSNFKNTILKVCGHVFCAKCVDDRLTNRMRKCPSCNKAFDRSDAMTMHL